MRACRWCGEDFEGHGNLAFCTPECRSFHLGQSSPFAGQDWLDGPRFLAWLVERVGEERLAAERSANSHFARRVIEWKKGEGAASVYSVDIYLIRLGVYLWELPPELFTDSPKNKNMPKVAA